MFGSFTTSVLILLLALGTNIGASIQKKEFGPAVRNYLLGLDEDAGG